MMLRQAIHAELVPYDPFGGPAYGRRDMPFAVIGGAIAGAVGTAFATGVAAAGAIGITGTVATVAGVVSAVATVATWVGIGLTVVGAITGDSSLMKIGGIVGIAGGVTGLAMGGLASMGAAAATETTAQAAASSPAASVSAANAGTSGGAANAAFQGASSSAAQAAGSALSSPMIAQGAADAAFSGASSFGSVASNAIGQGGMLSTTALPATVADQTASAAANAAKAPTVSSQSGSFFDSLVEPKNLMEIVKVGGTMMSGSAQEDMQNKIIKQKTATDMARLQFEKDQYGNQIANANVQGRLNINARAPTQAELDAQVANKAQNIKNMSNILTAPAGTK